MNCDFKKNNEDYIEIYKEGMFFCAYNYDALILSYIFDYKPYYQSFNIKAGFPIYTLEKVRMLLEYHRISYRMLKGKKIIDQYDTYDNQYAKYIDLIDKIFEKHNITFKIYYQKLKSKYQSSQFPIKGPKELNKYRIVVEVGDTIKVCYDDGEIDIVTIKQAYPIYKPIWTGKQNRRNGTAVEWESDVDPTKGEISSIAPLAKALLGKTINSIFCYMVERKKISGTILNIKKN